MNGKQIALTDCELQYNFISSDNCDRWRTGFRSMIAFAHSLINPWRIVRDDGVVIASSYDGFTAVEQAARNGRVETAEWDGLKLCEDCGDAYTTGRYCTRCAHQRMIDEQA